MHTVNMGKRAWLGRVKESNLLKLPIEGLMLREKQTAMISNIMGIIR